MAKLEKTIDDLEGMIVILFNTFLPLGFHMIFYIYFFYTGRTLFIALSPCPLPVCFDVHNLYLLFFPISFFSPLSFHVRTDELYAQKLKYKAISEELDHALNDMTSM